MTENYSQAFTTHKKESITGLHSNDHAEEIKDLNHVNFIFIFTFMQPRTRRFSPYDNITSPHPHPNASLLVRKCKDMIPGFLAKEKNIVYKILSLSFLLSLSLFLFQSTDDIKRAILNESETPCFGYRFTASSHAR